MSLSGKHGVWDREREMSMTDDTCSTGASLRHSLPEARHETQLVPMFEGHQEMRAPTDGTRLNTYVLCTPNG